MARLFDITSNRNPCLSNESNSATCSASGLSYLPYHGPGPGGIGTALQLWIHSSDAHAVLFVSSLLLAWPHSRNSLRFEGSRAATSKVSSSERKGQRRANQGSQTLRLVPNTLECCVDRQTRGGYDVKRCLCLLSCASPYYGSLDVHLHMMRSFWW